MLVGDMVVQPIFDGTARFSPTEAYRFSNPEVHGRGGDLEDWAPHRQFIPEDGMLEFALGGFLIRTGGRVVLIDTGIGPVQRGPFVGGQLLTDLARAGVAQESLLTSGKDPAEASSARSTDPPVRQP